MALPVQCDRADRAIFEVHVEMLGARARAQLLELAAALGGLEIFGRLLRQALLARELVGALAAEEDVRALLHHPAGEADRVARRCDTGDRAGVAVAAVHDRGVHLDAPVIGEDRTAPRVEMRIVLEHPDRRLDRVQRGAAARQDRRACVERAVQRRADRLVLGRRHSRALDHPGPAMDDQPPLRLRLLPLAGGRGRGRGGHEQDSQQH